MNRFMIRSILMFALWLGLTASLHWQELLVGVIVALVTSWASLKLSPEDPGEDISLASWLKFIPVLLREILISNIDLAIRILSPKMKINPGFVKVPTNLKSARKRWYLANAITLTPGTVTADIFEDSLLVHWIYIEGNSAEDQGKEIKESFENVLK